MTLLALPLIALENLISPALGVVLVTTQPPAPLNLKLTLVTAELSPIFQLTAALTRGSLTLAHVVVTGSPDKAPERLGEDAPHAGSSIRESATIAATERFRTRFFHAFFNCSLQRFASKIVFEL